jgi:putative peptidoglycan lipid II flippase
MAITRTISKLSVAALVAAALSWGASVGLQGVLGHGKVGSLAALVLGGLVLIAVYAFLALRLRVAEVVELAGTVRRRLPGR